jgi:LemA protein
MIIFIVLFLANSIISHFIAVQGQERRIGYLTTFLISFFFTALIGILIVLSSERISSNNQINYANPNKKFLGIFIFVGVLFFAGFSIFLAYRSSYNTAVEYQENVDQMWGDVGTTYQRRADLIPQLVATVKGAAENEKGILVQVTNARAGIVEAKSPEDFDKIGKQINSAINLAFEAYPQIRSTENFGMLQAQLEGTENRINKARQDYNESIKVYNTHIRGFFNSMFLNTDVFSKKTPFAAAAGSEIAPTVKF